MLSLTVEIGYYGPLAHALTRQTVADAVESSSTLDELAGRLRSIPGLAIYRGGSHVAVHCGRPDGLMSEARWAIVTEYQPGNENVQRG